MSTLFYINLVIVFTRVYKIKLRSVGYRLVYEVNDKEITVYVISVGKRERGIVYSKAETRKKV